MKMDRKLMALGRGVAPMWKMVSNHSYAKRKQKKEIKVWNGIGCKLMEGGKEWKVGAPPVAPLC